MKMYIISEEEYSSLLRDSRWLSVLESSDYCIDGTQSYQNALEEGEYENVTNQVSHELSEKIPVVDNDMTAKEFEAIIAKAKAKGMSPKELAKKILEICL